MILTESCLHVLVTILNYSYYLQHPHLNKFFSEMLQAEYILDLQKQLTLISSETRRESNGNLASEGSIPSTTSVDKVCLELNFMHQ